MAGSLSVAMGWQGLLGRGGSRHKGRRPERATGGTGSREACGKSGRSELDQEPVPGCADCPTSCEGSHGVPPREAVPGCRLAVRMLLWVQDRPMGRRASEVGGTGVKSKVWEPALSGRWGGAGAQEGQRPS